MEKNTPQKKKSSTKQSYSFLQADQVFVKKILSRNSSVGDHSSSSPLESSFRVSAEVPFKWESRPGEPKDKPEPENQTIEPPNRVSPFPAVKAARDPHAPPSPASKRVGVRQFLKKVIERGRKRSSSSRFSPSSVVAVARGFYSGEIATGLPSKSCFNNNSNNNDNNNNNELGFSTAPSTPWSSRGSSNNDFNSLRLDKPSRMQKFSKGCVKWMF